MYAPFIDSVILRDAASRGATLLQLLSPSFFFFPTHPTLLLDAVIIHIKNKSISKPHRWVSITRQHLLKVNHDHTAHFRFFIPL